VRRDDNGGRSAAASDATVEVTEPWYGGRAASDFRSPGDRLDP
jgi:predicted amidohydrolase YtcJ